MILFSATISAATLLIHNSAIAVLFSSTEVIFSTPIAILPVIAVGNIEVRAVAEHRCLGCGSDEDLDADGYCADCNDEYAEDNGE